MKLKLMEEKYNVSESRIETLTNQYEDMLKQKNEKIRELEIENELLKRRCEGKTPKL